MNAEPATSGRYLRAKVVFPAIERRFVRSLENLFGAYALLVDRTVCSLNSGETPEIVFTQQGENCEVKQPAIMQLLQSWRQT